MSEILPLNLDDVIAHAEVALSRASARRIKLQQPQLLSNAERRNLIARAVAVEEDGEIRPIFVKATRSPNDDPAAEHALDSGLVKEWVAAAYISSRAPDRDHGAALLAGDIATGVLVFEDLGANLGSLVDPLLRGTAHEAEVALTSYAGALARLHTDTLGCADAHNETFQTIFGGGRARRPLGWPLEDDVKRVVDAIGFAPPASEIELLSSRLSDPGPWQSLVHGDPCPDNALLVDGRIRLIDYEWARPSHALLDGIYWRMGFPTCWCAGRVPPDVAARVDAAYRAELGRSIPPALDDAVYRTELTYMCAVRLFTSLSWRLGGAIENDQTWGIWSIRGRLLWYLDAVISMATQADALPGLIASASAWRAALQRKWPEAQPLGLYPAFAVPSHAPQSPDA